MAAFSTYNFTYSTSVLQSIGNTNSSDTSTNAAEDSTMMPFHRAHRFVQVYITPILCVVSLVNNVAIALVSLAPRAGASYRRAIFPTVRRICLVLAAADAGAVLFYHSLAWFGELEDF